MKILDSVQFGEPVDPCHSIALEGAQILIDNYLVKPLHL